ncbi:MAG: hypothetical protein ACK42Z_09430, partial [Candidatus Kapaibacteriota bacterium]
ALFATVVLTFAQDSYSVVPFRVCSDKFSFLPFNLHNPLNLKYKKSTKASFFLTPSKFLIPELHSFGSYVDFNLPLTANGSLLVEGINAKKFSQLNFKFSIQADFFDKFNFATSIGGNLLSISGLGQQFSTRGAFFLEYQPSDNLIISFAFRNTLNPNPQVQKYITFGFQYTFWKMFTAGYSTNVNLGFHTSYDFYFTFSPFEKISCDIDIQTLPQVITFSVGYDFNDFNLSLFLQYNNKLFLSQTICLTINF